MRGRDQTDHAGRDAGALSDHACKRHLVAGCELDLGVRRMRFFERPAVLIVALVAERGEELVQEIPVRGVDLDDAERSVSGVKRFRSRAAAYHSPKPLPDAAPTFSCAKRQLQRGEAPRPKARARYNFRISLVMSC